MWPAPLKAGDAPGAARAARSAVLEYHRPRGLLRSGQPVPRRKGDTWAKMTSSGETNALNSEQNSQGILTVLLFVNIATVLTFVLCGGTSLAVLARVFCIFQHGKEYGIYSTTSG